MKGGAEKKQRARARRGRRVVAHGIRRQKIDAHKVSRALLALAQAKAEADAQTEHESQRRPTSKGSTNE